MPEGQQNPRLTPHPAFDQNVRMTPSRQAETCIAMYAVNALMPCEHVKHMNSFLQTLCASLHATARRNLRRQVRSMSYVICTATHERA